MKKKHRNITVEGNDYAWTTQGAGKYEKLKIWENKKVVFETLITRHHIITPKVVADIIRNPQVKEYYAQEIECCPFCGGEVRPHPKQEWQHQYFVCYHSETCWLYDKPFTLIPKNLIDSWNQRY